MNTPATKHAIERTSPKGGQFIGTCRLCGKEGLTLGDYFKEECPNPKGVTEDEALLDALEVEP